MALKSLIAIQEEYAETMVLGWARWGKWGHMPRIARGAYRKAKKELERWGGFSPEAIKRAIKDAHDVAVLRHQADEE